MDESAFIRRVVEEARIPSRETSVRGGSALAAPLEYLRRFELPCLTVNFVFSLPLQRLAAADGVRVLLDGEGGDEIFGVSRYLIADELAHGRLLSAGRLAARLPHLDPDARHSRRTPLRRYGLLGLVPYRAHRSYRRLRGARPAPWLSPEARRLYSRSADRWSWKQLDGPRWWRHLADRLTDLRGRLGAHELLAQKAILGDVELRHPFLDDLDLIELALRIPPHLLFDARVDRPLLRESLQDLLPQEVRARHLKSDLGALWLDYLTGRDWPPFSSMLGDAKLEVARYVDPENVRARFGGDPPPRVDYAWAQTGWRLFGVEAWLRFQADPAVPERVLARWGLEEPTFEPVGEAASR